MSTVILGRLANPAPTAWARALQETGGDEGKKHWAEALAAVIPGEAIAGYSAMIAFFTIKGDEAVEALTGTMSASDEPAAGLNNAGWALGLTVVILLFIPFIYAASAGMWWQRRHALRWGVAMVAFPVWLWLLPLSPWDSLVDLDGAVRGAVGIVAAVIVVSLANYLFKKWPLPDPPKTRGPGSIGQPQPPASG